MSTADASPSSEGSASAGSTLQASRSCPVCGEAMAAVNVVDESGKIQASFWECEVCGKRVHVPAGSIG